VSLEVDSNDTVYVCFHSERLARIRYAQYWFNGTSWQHTVTSFPNSRPGYANQDLALAGDDTPWIVYHAYPRLHVYYLDGATWSEHSRMTSSGISFGGGGPVLQIASDGTPEGVYITNANELTYAEGSPGIFSWPSEVIETGVSERYVGYGQTIELILDDSGTPHVLFFYGTLDARYGYATKTATDWTVKELGMDGQLGLTMGSSGMCLDSQNAPHFAFAQNGNLYYGREWE
jgi:hypothetical protein